MENPAGYELLVGEGIGGGTARRLTQAATLEAIKQQIEWLEFRNPKSRPAMLRKAIEEQWSEPDGCVDRRQHERVRQREERDKVERAARDSAIAEQKRAFAERRTRLLASWRGQSPEDQQKCVLDAVERATNGLTRRAIQRSSLDDPSMEILETMSLTMSEPIRESS